MQCEKIEGWEGEYSKVEAARLLLGIVVFGLVRIASLVAIVLWVFPVGLFFVNAMWLWVIGLAVIGSIFYWSCIVIVKCQQRYMAIRGLREVRYVYVVD